MQSLRALMTGLPDIPPFRMLLAPGWEQHEVTQETATDLARRASERIRHLGRPDLDAQLSNDLHRAFTRMQRAGSRVVYLPTALDGGTLLPMSLVASTIKGENGQSLDPYVTQLFRDRGAEFFDDLKTTVRWIQESRGTEDMSGGISSMVNYVIAAPDSGRRRAVLFSTTITQSANDLMDEEMFQNCIALSDAMISTFVWMNPAAATESGI